MSPTTGTTARGGSDRTPGGPDGRGESDLGLSPHPRGLGEPRTSYRHDHRAEHSTPSPPRARSAAAQDWHELATVSENTLGSPGRHALFHGRSGYLAWAGDALCVGGDGA